MEAKTTQGQKLEKRTNRAWRTFWFLFYLVIIPATVGLVSFYLSRYLSRNAYFATNFTTIITLGSFFIVYKLFDKYLEVPILKNRASNANFRVHAPFFFSLVALTSAFVILIFTVEQQLFKPLPLIALGVVYSFTWLYYRWKPIDQVDYTSKTFKHAATLEEAAKCFHNIVVIFHLAFQFVMIYFYMSTPVLWGGIGIPINVTFWVVGFKVTASTRKQLQEGLAAGDNVDILFLTFKKQFAQVMVAASASFMIINIFYPLIADPSGLLAHPSLMMLFIYGVVIAGVLLVKAETYTGIYFHKQIVAVSGELPLKGAATGKESQGNQDASTSKLNKISTYATSILIGTSLVMGFVPGIPAATPITVAAVYAMVLGERKAKLTDGWWYSLSHLANTICLLASISFGVLPSIPNFQIPFIVQATVFIVALYVTIECYCVAKYFKKHRIAGLLDAMAIGSFTLVGFSCYEIVLDLYTWIARITSIAGAGASGAFVAIFLSGIVALLACYRLFRTRYHARTSRRVKVAFDVAFLWVATAITVLVILGERYPINADPVNLIIWTAMWWAGLYILYVVGNSLLGIYFQKDMIEVVYLASIVYIACIPALVIYNFPTLAPILIATIGLTITIGYHIKWGVNLHKVAAKVRERYLWIARPLLVVQMLAMQLGWYLAAGLDPMLAAYIAVVVTAGIGTLCMRTDFFKRKTAEGLDVVALFYTSVMIFKGLLWVTWGTPYVYLIPLLAAALFAFIPFSLLRFFGLIKTAFSRIAFANSILITALLLALPTAILFEIQTHFHLPFNVFADLFYTLLFALGIFNAFNGALRGLGVNPAYIKPFKWGMTGAMAGISVFGAITLYGVVSRVANPEVFPAMISLAFTSFFAMNFITLAILYEQKLASKDATIAASRIGYFGFVVTVSLFLTQLIQLAYPASAFPVDLGIAEMFWYVLFFCLFALVLSSIPRLVSPGIKLHAIERVFTTGCWLLLDVFGCLYIAGFLDTNTLLGTGTLFIMLIACTAPATRYFLRQAGTKPSPLERAAGTLSKYAFLAASLAFLLERARLGALDPPAKVNPLLYIMLLSNVACFGLLFASMIGRRGTRFSKLMVCSLVLVLALAFLPTTDGISFLPTFSGGICVIAAFVITAKAGNTNEKIRWIRTAMLSTVLFSIIAWFHGPPPEGMVSGTLAQIHFIEYSACLFIAIAYAIATTEGKKSLVEGNVASVLGSLLVFQLLVAFTTTSIFHSANITLIVYLSLMAWYFDRAGSARKYSVLKVLGLCVVVYITTGICALTFTKPGLGDVNASMTFLVTYSAVAFIIIRFFRPFMLKYRRQILAPILAAFNVFVPVFLYLLFTYYAVVPVEQPILVLLCADIGFFLCFLSIGVYKWNLTKDVWKMGWWLWAVFPWLNFYLIFKAVQGVDVIDGLNFFSLGDIPGSGIITFIMVTAMYLPIIWYKVKKYYYTLMLAIWGENLLLVGWVVQNVFAGNVPLTVMSFFVFSTGLLLPLLYKKQSWKAMAGAWAFLAASNVLFLHFLLMETRISMSFIVSIELIVTSVLGMLYSAIPKSPARWQVLVTSYTCLLAGMWSIVYFTIYEVTRHAFISVNIAFIAIAFSLFSSRYLKVNQVKTRALIALILMANLSLLAFNTLALIPGLVLLAIFVGITVFGGSFYTMNQYKMIFHVDKHIPWSILGIGSALSTSSLVVSAWQAPPMIVGFVFSLTAALFFYKDVPIQVKAAFIPLPATFLAEQLVVTLLPAQVLVATLFFSTCYLALFQVVANAGVRMDASKLQGINTGKIKALLPRINLAIFIANAVQVSTILTLLLDAPAVLTLLLPFLLICCQSFATRTGIIGKQPRSTAFMTAGSIVLHALIAASIMVLLPVPAMNTPLPPELASLLAKATVFSTSMFVQLTLLDMNMFKIMVARVRFVMMLCTYALAFNIIAAYLYINHGDPSLFALSMCALNVLTMQLWQNAFPARKGLAGALKKALYNGILISASSLTSRWIALDPLMAVDPTGLASWLMYFTCTLLFLIMLNLLLNKTLPKRANLIYQLLLYFAFQVFLSLSWIRLLPVLGPVGLVSISGLALVETALAFLPFHFIRHGLLQRAKSFTAYAPLALLVYFEVSLIVYATSAMVLGTIESLLLGLGCMFVLSLVEFHKVACVKPSITWFINLASYVPFMLAVLLTWTGRLPVTGSIGLVSMIGLALVETALAFYVFHVVRHRLAQRAFARQPFAWLVLPVYVELSLLAYAASALLLGLMESVLVGCAAMFLLTLVEIHVVKCVKPSVGYGLNLASYLPLMVAFALAWLGEFPGSVAGAGLVSVAVLALLETILALYPFHVIGQRLLSRHIQRRTFAAPALIIYFELSFVVYASSELLLGTMGSVLAALGCLFLLTLADVYGMKYLRPDIGFSLNLASYLPFMVAFALSWVEAFPLGLSRTSLISLAVLLFLETVLAFYPFHIIRNRLLKRSTRREAFGPIVGLLYLEISLIVYASASLGLSVIASMTCAFACLFALALVESYGVKCVKVAFSMLLVIAGWFSFTISGLVLVSEFTISSRGLFMATLATFTALQQYTTFEVFSMCKVLYPASVQQQDKARQAVRRSVGLASYLFIFLALQAFVSEAGFGLITQSLAISFGVFVLSLIDRGGLNYFGKRLATVMIEVCWILFSVALTSGAIWLFGSTPALVPIIGLGIDLEIVAAVGFLKDFGSKDYAVRSKVAYRILITCLYVIFSMWPNFLWVQEPLLDTSLVLGSLLLFELFLRGDVKGVKAIPSKATQLFMRGFDIGICGWLAVLSFQGLHSIPGSHPVISTMLSAVIGIVLLYIPLQPFKKGGLLKAVYWSAFSIACGTLTTSLSYYYTFVPVYVHFLFGGLVFFLLIRVVLERKDRSPAGKFMLNLLYYAVIYATVTGILFGFMRVTLIVILLAIIIFGAILSGMVIFYEKRGTISIKWRLTTSLTLIGLIIAFLVLVILWLMGVTLPPGIITW